MDLSEMRFPRQLEADGSAEKIREALTVLKTRLRPGGGLEVPVLPVTESLVNALKKARLQRRIRFGYDEIMEKLAAEKKGIDEVLQKTKSPQTERLSRLLLFSNDGAGRLYRHIEQTLMEHRLRILGCELDIESTNLGPAITGGRAGIKVMLVEHKDAVADVLRAIIQNGR
ncbi:MAG: hypothetical protein EG826_05835 [Deltaproteobacteria bacterium]|nr:hypothetical protein [Deltaproteobacteria bacterium]